MNLHVEHELFRQAIQATSQRLNIPPEFIEKDYWVTYALYLIYNSDIRHDVVFKGGTSLSKCFKLIDRFSEDIDLIIIRRSKESNHKASSKLKLVSNIVNIHMPEVFVEALTIKRGLRRKTAHLFERSFNTSRDQIGDKIVIESTLLGNHEPFQTSTICSFVGDMMIEGGLKTHAEKNRLMPFPIQVLSPMRTYCEKIMSLVRFSHTENPIDSLKRKVRHIYDLHKLLELDYIDRFFQSDDFENLLLKVANDDVISFKNNNQWLNFHPCDALIFKDINSTWTHLQSTYNSEFKELVYGVFPENEAILMTLSRLQARLKEIQWNISV